MLTKTTLLFVQSTHDTDTRSKPVPASHSQSNTQKPSEGMRGGGSEEVRSPEEEEGDDGPLAAAFRAKRRDLKPTEVSNGPVKTRT